MLAAYHPDQHVRQRLLETEVQNLKHFGYGVKGFTLSMIETAIDLSGGEIRGSDIHRIIDWGRQMLAAPVELLDGVRETIETLAGSYTLMLLTKGDLFDQEQKLARSGIGERFSAVEIVSEKNVETYRRIIRRAGIEPSQFLMVGNSLKSDVLPALDAGASAVHIPYYTTWAHERVDDAAIAGRSFPQLTNIRELLTLLPPAQNAT
jgi:putative hydrolase of the HAD superfamily